MDDGQQGQQRSLPDGYEMWQDYWTTQDMPWRIEPEISDERQRFLTQRLAVEPDIAKGIYPFRDENGSIKLDRADVEWLLMYHQDHIHGSIYPFDRHRLQTTGLDVRGADLTGANLAGLVLTGLRGGLTARELSNIRPEYQNQARDLAAVHLDGAALIQAHLEAATLPGAHLENASCFGVHFEGAVLTQVDMHDAVLISAQMKGAVLFGARLDGAIVRGAYLEGAVLSGAHLEHTELSGSHLEGAMLNGAHLEGAYLRLAHLEGADLTQARLQGTALNGALFTGKRMPDDALERVRAWVPNFRASLSPANLQEAVFDDLTRLDAAALGDDEFGSVKLAEAHFNDVNLTVVDWAPVKMIGDEQEARDIERNHEHFPQPGVRLGIYQAGVRANRQLAIALRSQGLNEDADRFAYNGQKLQREVLRQQQRHSKLLMSWTLAGLSGYGYRLWRILVVYGVVLFVFTILYWLLGIHSFPRESAAQSLWDSFLVSH